MREVWERLRRTAQRGQEHHVPAGTRPGRPQKPHVSRRRVRLGVEVTGVFSRPTSGGGEALVARCDSVEGPLELVWLGRRRLAGLGVGSRLSVTGLLTTMHGRRTIFNPEYELAPIDMETS